MYPMPLLTIDGSKNDTIAFDEKEKYIRNLFARFENNDWNHCFICRSGLDTNNSNKKTKEHIIPDWMQKRFKIQNAKMLLANETPIKYNQLLVPCCEDCNYRMSRLFESPIRNALNKGFNEFSRLDSNILVLWAIKIAYGLSYKESFLPAERKNPNSDFIKTAYDLYCMHSNRSLLHCAVNGKIPEEEIGSVLMCQLTDTDEEHFFFWEDAKNRVVAFELGSIALIVFTDDLGYRQDVLQLEPFMSKDEFRNSINHIIRNVPYIPSMTSRVAFLEEGFYEDSSKYHMIILKNGLRFKNR